MVEAWPEPHPISHCARRGARAPVAPAVLRDGQVGEEDGDGQHAGVQVVEQLRDLLKHALAHLPPCPRPGAAAALVRAGQDPTLP